MAHRVSNKVSLSPRPSVERRIDSTRSRSSLEDSLDVRSCRLSNASNLDVYAGQPCGRQSFSVFSQSSQSLSVQSSFDDRANARNNAAKDVGSVQTSKSQGQPRKLSKQRPDIGDYVATGSQFLTRERGSWQGGNASALFSDSFPQWLTNALADLEARTLFEHNKSLRCFNLTEAKRDSRAPPFDIRAGSLSPESPPTAFLPSSVQPPHPSGSPAQVTVVDSQPEPDKRHMNDAHCARAPEEKRVPEPATPIRDFLSDDDNEEASILASDDRNSGTMMQETFEAPGFLQGSKEDGGKRQVRITQNDVEADAPGDQMEMEVPGSIPLSERSAKISSLSDSPSIDTTYTNARFVLWSAWDVQQFRASRRIGQKRSEKTTKTVKVESLSDIDNDSSSSSDEEKQKRNQSKLSPTRFLWKSGTQFGERLQESVSDNNLRSSHFRKRYREVWFHPQSPTRLLWDFFGGLLVGYECIVCPMLILDIPETGFLYYMGWILRIFWTIDLFLSFQTGYFQNNDHVEMRASHVAVSYIGRWFIPDVFLLFCDWLEVFVSTSLAGLDITRPFLKALRMLRIARMIRLVRVASQTSRSSQDAHQHLQYIFRSELVSILISLLKMVCLLLWFCHLISCCWLALDITADGSGGPTWRSDHLVASKGLAQGYAVAFHWSLSQFAGEPDVHPMNVTERLFTILVMFISFIWAAWFVSSVTSALTRLEIVGGQKNERMMMLKQYLIDNKVSRKVSIRLLRNVQRNVSKQERYRAEDSIELLRLVSASLLKDLHFEINIPILVQHPFFGNYLQMHHAVMKHVCDGAVTRLELVRGELIFEEDHSPLVPQMYFLVSGSLCYTQQGKGKRYVEAGIWACEPTLWCPWVHCGTLSVSSSTAHLAILNAQMFQKKVSERTLSQARPVLDYADEYIEVLNRESDENLTDLHDGIDCYELANSACPRASMAVVDRPEKNGGIIDTFLQDWGLAHQPSAKPKDVRKVSSNGVRSRFWSVTPKESEMTTIASSARSEASVAVVQIVDAADSVE